MSEQKYIRVEDINEPINPKTYTPADILSGMWVPVSERLPEPVVDVLALYGDGRMDIDWVDHEGRFGYENLYDGVTHWMPLPDPPKPQECGDDFCPI